MNFFCELRSRKETGDKSPVSLMKEEQAIMLASALSQQANEITKMYCLHQNALQQASAEKARLHVEIDAARTTTNEYQRALKWLALRLKSARAAVREIDNKWLVQQTFYRFAQATRQARDAKACAMRQQRRLALALLDKTFSGLACVAEEGASRRAAEGRAFAWWRRSRLRWAMKRWEGLGAVLAAEVDEALHRAGTEETLAELRELVLEAGRLAEAAAAGQSRQWQLCGRVMQRILRGHLEMAFGMFSEATKRAREGSARKKCLKRRLVLAGLRKSFSGLVWMARHGSSRRAAWGRWRRSRLRSAMERWKGLAAVLSAQSEEAARRLQRMLWGKVAMAFDLFLEGTRRAREECACGVRLERRLAHARLGRAFASFSTCLHFQKKSNRWSASLLLARHEHQTFESRTISFHAWRQLVDHRARHAMKVLHILSPPCSVGVFLPTVTSSWRALRPGCRSSSQPYFPLLLQNPRRVADLDGVFCFSEQRGMLSVI